MKVLDKNDLYAVMAFVAALLFSPVNSNAQEIYGHIGDLLKKNNFSELGESLPDINIRLTDLDNHELITNITTDEDGRFNYYLSVKPTYEVDINHINSIRIFDLQGRLEEKHYGNNFQISPNSPSGMRLYLIEDIFGNKITGKFLSLEGEILNAPKLPISDIKTPSYKRFSATSSRDEPRNLQIIISDPNRDFFQYVDTLTIDNENQELNVDLIANIELEWPEDMDERPYRNFLHFVKKILYSTDEDIERAISEGRPYYHYRWQSFPINLFPNDEEAPNDNYRNSIREFEEDVSNIRYGGYSHDFVNLVDEAPDSLGGEYDFSQEASWYRIYSELRNDGLYHIVRSRIYISNNTNRPDVPIKHESLNQLVNGRDSANPIDVQHAGGPIPNELSENDEHLLIFVKNLPPYYIKLLNHREY